MDGRKIVGYILIRIRMLLVLVCDKRLNFLHDGLIGNKVLFLALTAVSRS